MATPIYPCSHIHKIYVLSMTTHSGKNQENESTSFEKEKNHPTFELKTPFQFVDNRPSSIVQRKIQASADNFVSQKAVFKFTDKRARTQAQKVLQQKQSFNPAHELKENDQPIQRVNIATSSGDKKQLRNYHAETGNLDRQTWRDVDTQIGATNALEIGLKNIWLLIRGGLTANQLGTIVGTLPTMNDVHTLIRKAFPAVVKPYQNISGNNQLILDYVTHPAIAAPTANELTIAYGNYLAGAHAPAAYAPNLHANFVANYTAAPPNYYDFQTGNFYPLHTLYDDYIERTNTHPIRTLQQFAHSIVTGSSYTLNSGTLAGVNAWANSTGLATQQELTLLGGVPIIIRNYNDDVDRAIQIMSTIPGLTQNVINHAPNGNHAMVNLLSYLGNNNNNAQTINNVHMYQNIVGVDVLNNNFALNPVRPFAWETGFINALQTVPAAHRPNLYAFLQANANNLLTLRNQMYNHDNGALPNLALPMTLIANVINENLLALGNLFNHFDAIIDAHPQLGANNLPFGNRAGGLAGHFRKHVLQMNGNTDNVEPGHWLTDLNILANFTYGQVNGLGLTSAEKTSLFGDPNPPNDTLLAGAPQLIAFCNGASPNAGTFVNALANLYEATYHTYCQNVHDHPTGKYVYFHGGMVKINSYLGDTFTVAAKAGGVFDFSSGYKPYQSGGAQFKWMIEHTDRLWLL